MRDCVAIAESAIISVMPAKAGIQNLLKILDSPVSSTGQALRLASLEDNPAYAGRNDKNGDCGIVCCAGQTYAELEIFMIPSQTV
jgi:hypothetical protein